MDLVLIIALTLLIIPLALFTDGILRTALGLLFILFIPGYSMIAALFPGKDSLDAAPRIALSFIMSAAFAPLIGLLLNYSPWGIKLTPIIVCYAAFVVIALTIALTRRYMLPSEQRFSIHFTIRFPAWSEGHTIDKMLSVILVLSIIGSAGLLIYVFSTPKPVERFTEFYILGSEGVADDYPQIMVLGEKAEVTIGIINHEHQNTIYYAEVSIDGQVIQTTETITLANEEKKEVLILIIPFKAGEDQKVELLLFKGEEKESYRNLQFYLDVETTK